MIATLLQCMRNNSITNRTVTNEVSFQELLDSQLYPCTIMYQLFYQSIFSDLQLLWHSSTILASVGGTSLRQHELETELYHYHCHAYNNADNSCAHSADAASNFIHIISSTLIDWFMITILRLQPFFYTELQTYIQHTYIILTIAI